MLMENEFPEFIKSLTQAELPFEGLRGWVLQSEFGQVLFNESEIEIVVPEHKHGDQWGIVVAGRIELIISGEQNTFVQGDSYFIPADTLHSAVIYPGFRAVDYFADKNRYKQRSSDV